MNRLQVCILWQSKLKFVVTLLFHDQIIRLSSRIILNISNIIKLFLIRQNKERIREVHHLISPRDRKLGLHFIDFSLDNHLYLYINISIKINSQTFYQDPLTGGISKLDLPLQKILTFETLLISQALKLMISYPSMYVTPLGERGLTK